MPYNVVVEEPVRSLIDGRSYIAYGLGIRGEDCSIWIYLTDFGDFVEVASDKDRRLVSDFLAEQNCSLINVTETIIDGVEGALGGGILPSGRIIFCASYAPEYAFLGGKHKVMTNCRLFSTFPPQETVNLLESIHIERKA